MMSEEDPLANVLCIKCGKSLSDMANIREAIVGPEPEPPRLVCHGYRLLLPPLGGERPPRSITWVRRCMRAIIGALLTRPRVARTPAGRPSEVSRICVCLLRAASEIS